MPSETPTECTANAQLARAEAAATSLEHVRTKHLTAAAVWEGMGRRAAKVAALRLQREAAQDVAPQRS